MIIKEEKKPLTTGFKESKESVYKGFMNIAVFANNGNFKIKRVEKNVMVNFTLLLGTLFSQVFKHKLFACNAIN